MNKKSLSPEFIQNTKDKKYRKQDAKLQNIKVVQKGGKVYAVPSTEILLNTLKRHLINCFSEGRNQNNQLNRENVQN